MENVINKFYSKNGNTNKGNIIEKNEFLPKKRYSQNSNFKRENESHYFNNGPRPNYLQFSAFDGKEFINNLKPHSLGLNIRTNDVPNDMKLQILDAKLKNLELKQNQEKNEIVEIVKKNMFSSPKKMFITPQVKSKKRKIQFNEEDEEDLDTDEDENKIKKDKLRFKENLEEFREEITRQLRQFKKSNEKVNIVEILQEIDDLKMKRKNKDKYAEKAKDGEMYRLADNVKSISEEISKKISIFFSKEDVVSEKNEEVINSFGKDLKGFKDEMLIKINGIETKQKKQIEGIKFILDNGNIKNKPDSNKILSGYRNKNGVLEAPNSNEKVVKSQKNKIKEDENVEQLSNFILKKRADNDLLKNEVFKKEENEINLNDWKNNKLLTMKEKMKLQMEGQNKKALDKIKKQLAKFQNNNFSMKKINQFRSLVYTIIGCFRFSRTYIEKENSIKTASLKTFTNYYESLDSELKSWIFHSVKIPYLSILNFDQLKIDITDSDSIFSSEIETKDRYIKLETRLKGFMEHLIDHTDEKNINPNLLSYLYLISTNSSYIPQKFYTLFEINRIEFKNDVLTNMNKFQQIMILNIYLLCKVFIFHILIDHMFSSSSRKNADTKKNYKMVASVFYHEIRKNIMEHNNIIPNNKIFNDNEKRLKFSYVESDKENKSPVNNKTDSQYDKAYKEFQSNLKNDKTSETEANLLKDINKSITLYAPDTNENGLEFIEKQIYSISELSQYYKFSKLNNFDLSEKINEWSEKIYKMIFEKNSIKHDKISI